MIALIVKGGLCYLLGSVVASLLIGRLRGGVDIRSLGSGNAGATNAMRTLGKKVALAVFVIDLAKGWIATALIAPWTLPSLAPRAPEVDAWSVTVCALAVMLGHIYPLWYGFRGGKGMATLLGAVLGVHTWLVLPMVVAWLATVILSGFVGLGSMLATVALAVSLAASGANAALLAFGILAVLLIAFTHRSNIARMRAGTEARARRLWLFGARRGEP
jgi:acyl phosphate:glycerol-3-phosphate acyltransferase